MTETEKLMTKLRTLTKAELLNIFEDLLTQDNLSFDGLNNYFSTTTKMTTQEEYICNKISTQQELTADEHEIILKALSKVKNRKVGNLAKAKSSFVGFLINKKLQYVFEQCWKIYPRKVGKQAGAKAFVKLFNDVKYDMFNATAEYIAKKITEYKNDCEREEKEDQFIMHFSTFCNSKKYL